MGVRAANFAIVSENDDEIIIRDVGPHDEYLTVTNAAEQVVETLFLAGKLNGRRLFYYDSIGNLDELCHQDGVFTGFAPGGPQA